MRAGEGPCIAGPGKRSRPGQCAGFGLQDFQVVVQVDTFNRPYSKIASSEARNETRTFRLMNLAGTEYLAILTVIIEERSDPHLG